MKAAFHTLGCKVNQYETESLREQFRRGGYQIVDENDFADVYVINTCTVTNLADRKSRQFIRRARKINPEAVVAVTGCYAQMNPEEAASIEGVQIVTGTDEKHILFERVQEYLKVRKPSVTIKNYDELTQYEDLGIIEAMDSRSRAFVKIQEGCNRFCSYCVIPYARGSVRSRRAEEILDEAEGLISSGYREIVLTGINTALYGAETGTLGIADLIGQLSELPGDFRIRLSSLEPTVIDADYVRKLLPYDRLCHHLHLSIQSGSDRILKSMDRGYGREKYLDIVRTLREFDPCYGITTDIIVGFPGETEEDFRDSLRIVEQAGFLRVHAFKYSPREGTPAAKMNGQIPGTVKQERVRALIEAAGRQEEQFLQTCRGQVRKALFEKTEPETQMACGYTDNYIPVYVPGGDNLFNQFYDVKLLKIYRDGMLGEIVR